MGKKLAVLTFATATFVNWLLASPAGAVVGHKTHIRY